ncbi:hypothetical protein VTO42DRAFT_8343 [Malbranchea cinnamomea]
MPRHSRDRSYARDWERDRNRDRDRGRDERVRERDLGSPRRYRRYEEYDYDEDDYDDDDEIDGDDYDDGFDDRRVRAHGDRDRSAREHSKQTRRRDYYDDDGEFEQGGSDEDGSNVIFVDSRPGFARPPNSRPIPARRDARDYYREEEQGFEEGAQRQFERERDRLRYKHKAKESPATSPVKKRDRERDREGWRRRDSTADEGSPMQRGKLRDRRGKDRDRDRYYGESERDEVRATRSGGEERERERRRARQRERQRKHASADSANSAAHLLSADALAKLNARNEKAAAAERARAAKQERKRRKQEALVAEKLRGRASSTERENRRGKRRLVSGAILEEGRSPELKGRGGYESEKWRRGGGGGRGDNDDGSSRWWRGWSKKKKIVVGLGVVAVLLIIIISVAVSVSKKNSGGDDDSQGASDEDVTKGPSNRELDGLDPDSIPANARGTYFDPFSWYDTADFNVTYTEETVGGLPIMGLNSTWDDSARPNEHVPPLDEEFPYGKQPVRGVNIGGWLSLEPFITPSYFEEFRDYAIDEWDLTRRWGNNAKKRMEEHYATFITEQTFKEIRDAGFDHVRIPYGYWIVKTFEDEPYVERVGWRYLLRAIEYCRKYGLRVCLDMHGVPGSQNGWNHSGRSGVANWLNGTDGELWGQRSLDVHNQLSQFFAQPRYKNVITMYGLANEVMMLRLEIEPVLEWTKKAAEIVEKNGMKQYIVFADGFLRLSKWKTMLQDTGYNLLLDTHQYTIFNTDLIKKGHQEKLEFVCEGWTDLISESNDKETGWGPTICGEWSQADTDCAKFLNNVGVGTRWEGTYRDPSGKGGMVLTPHCAAASEDSNSDRPCRCDKANADPSEYPEEYKTFLKTYAEAQISAFEKGWGWFYWTWKTESAVQWSWKKGLEAGTLPKKAYDPAFKCGDAYPDLGDLPEYY